MNTFTARETALDAYRAALSVRTRPAMGSRLSGETLAQLRQTRQARLRAAESVILTALKVERVLLSEPSDDDLQFMLARVHDELRPGSRSSAYSALAE